MFGAPAGGGTLLTGGGGHPAYHCDIDRTMTVTVTHTRGGLVIARLQQQGHSCESLSRWSDLSQCAGQLCCRSCDAVLKQGLHMLCDSSSMVLLCAREPKFPACVVLCATYASTRRWLLQVAKRRSQHSPLPTQVPAAGRLQHILHWEVSGGVCTLQLQTCT